MWSVTGQANQASGQIVPTRVLYQYDGPLIFSAKFGFVDAFFVKFDELENSHLFVVAQVEEQLVDLIAQGKLSIRSALAKDFYWVVEASKDLFFNRYWVCAKSEFPEELLPEKYIPVSERFGLAPDSYEQLTAFFSVDYRGAGLAQKGMRFSQFKQLVDNTHEAARNLLSPILLLGSKTATFDFDIAEPAFSSLIITIQNPTVNRTIVEKKIRGQDLDIEIVRQQFALQRDIFFDEMSELVTHAEHGELSHSLVEERFSLLDRIQAVIPTQDNQLASVFFSANQSNRFASVLVTEKTGGVINRAFRAAEARPVDEFGTVVVTNHPSRSFVLMSRRGKQVTCYVSFDSYETLRTDPQFRNGVTVKARGHLTRRTRRDILHVEGVPVIVSEPIY